MSEQGLLDFGFEEEVNNEPSKTDSQTEGKGTQKESTETSQAESGNGEGTKTEPTAEGTTKPSGNSDGEDVRVDRGAVKKPARQTTRPVTDGFTEGQWHRNVIGVPRGKVNSYFQGVVTNEKGDNKQVLVPFKDIKAITRQVYVDDIYAENPTWMHVHHWVLGSFAEVITLVTQEVFEEMQEHPELKGIKVRYQYVSLHGDKKRVYELHHPNQPTETELKKLDAKIDEMEWATLSDSERKRRKTEAQKAGISVPDIVEEPELILPEEEESQPFEEALEA